MTARSRQASRRVRELKKGRRGRLIYLTDEEYRCIKEIIGALRNAEKFNLGNTDDHKK